MKLHRTLFALVAVGMLALAAVAYAGPMHGNGHGFGSGSGNRGTCGTHMFSGFNTMGEHMHEMFGSVMHPAAGNE